MVQSEFKVVFHSGESTILRGGSDITEAFEINGYTDMDVARIKYIHDVTPASVEHPEYPHANFCCPNCRGLLSMRRYEKMVSRAVAVPLFSYVCDSCTFETEGRSNPERAMIGMNFRCAHNREATKKELGDLENETI